MHNKDSANARPPVKRKGKGGRRPTLTKEKQELILAAIKDAQSVEVAAMKAGVPVSTLYSWLEKGREGTASFYVQFLEAYARAEAEAQEMLLDSIRNGEEKYWAAKAWILERRFPNRWGRTVDAKVQHSGAVKIIFEEVSADGSGGKEAKPKDNNVEGTEGKREQRQGAGDIDVLTVPQRE